jgi:hypothetical protein
MNDILVVNADGTMEPDGSFKITGAFTSVIDAFINLSKFKKVRFKTFSKTMTVTQWINTCIENKHFGDKKTTLSMIKEPYLSADIIVCSTRFLVDVQMFDLEVNCKKIIFLDSFDVACPRYFDRSQFINSIPCEDYIFLGNPSNKDKLPNFREYYHTFSPERLDTISFENDHYYYSRKDKWYIKIGRRSWFENIGKGIFERLYHNKSVHYTTKGMTQRDGLYFYLRRFGVDGEQDHYPLPITRKDIEDKLFMKEDDLLVQLT